MRREGNSKVTAQSAGRFADASTARESTLSLETLCLRVLNSREWNSMVYLVGRKIRREETPTAPSEKR